MINSAHNYPMRTQYEQQCSSVSASLIMSKRNYSATSEKKWHKILIVHDIVWKNIRDLKNTWFFVKLTRSTGIIFKSTKKLWALIKVSANDLRLTAVVLYGISIRPLTFHLVTSDICVVKLISINIKSDSFRISSKSSWNISIMKSSKTFRILWSARISTSVSNPFLKKTPIIQHWAGSIFCHLIFAALL